MNEKEIKNLIESDLRAQGVSKFWHPTKVRIGSDTLKSFREVSDPEIRCESSDICFVDVGPILHDHEADYGRTFIPGSLKTTPLIDACHEVFRLTAEKWKSTRMTGKDLLAFAGKKAQEYGYEINPHMSGHRVGDFPHKLHSSAKLFELGFSPSENLWVLEIHLIDSAHQRGAFFEDILF